VECFRFADPDRTAVSDSRNRLLAGQMARRGCLFRRFDLRRSPERIIAGVATTNPASDEVDDLLNREHCSAPARPE
jgi:hypothetical protein